MSEQDKNLLSADSAANRLKEQFGLTAKTDIQVTTGDIVEIVTTRFEREVKLQIRASERAIVDARAVVTAAETELEERCSEDAEKHGLHAQDKFREAFAEIGLGFNYSKSVTIGESGYIVTHRVWSHKTTQYGSQGFVNSIEWPSEMSFRKSGAVKLRTAVDKAKAALKVLEQRQMDWRRKLAEIPDVERRARAAMAEQALNQSEGGQLLMQSISDTFNEEFADSELFTPVGLLES